MRGVADGGWGWGVVLFKRGVVSGEGVCTDMQILMTENVLRGKVVSGG